MRQYAERHSGAAIVCGGGPALIPDIERALHLRPHAVLLGVNFSASVVPGIRHVWTQHIEIAGKIKGMALEPVRVHSRPRSFQVRSGGTAWFTGVSKELEDQVDYLWPDLGWVGGSSGFAAALWAKHGIGFDEVILAGVGLQVDSRKYSDEYCEVTTKALRPPAHDGNTHFASPDSVEHWHQCINNFILQNKTTGIYSMSGWTSERLGLPPC